MSRFSVKDLDNSTFRIEGQGAVGMYLIVGSEKAALIDTGLGTHNIAEFVKTLTDKPVEVLLTHGHLDHAGGMYYFDEVHLSHKDIPVLKGNTKQDRLAYMTLLRDFMGKTDWEEEDVCEVRDVYITDIADGQEFRLGGRSLKAVAFPGHTHGSMAFYDDLTRFLFVGDACNNSTFLFLEESTSVSEYLASLRFIRANWLPKVSHMVISHDFDAVPDSCVEDVIECCERVLAGTDDKETFVHPNPMFDGMTVRWAAKGAAGRVDKFGNLAYNYCNVT